MVWIPVASLTGKTSNIQLKFPAVVIHLKQTIQDKEGIPLDKLSIFFKDKELNDYDLLTSFEGDSFVVKLKEEEVAGVPASSKEEE